MAQEMVEEIEEETALQEGLPEEEEEQPPEEGGPLTEEERIIALREGDWANARKLVQEVLTERGQAEGIFGRDYDKGGAGRLTAGKGHR